QADHQALVQQPLRSLLLLGGQARQAGPRRHPAELGSQLEAAEVLSGRQVGVSRVASRRHRYSHARIPSFSLRMRRYSLGAWSFSSAVENEKNSVLIPSSRSNSAVAGSVPGMQVSRT